MQTVSSEWTAEVTDSARRVAQSFLISWKKESTLGSVTFTIGESFIGGDDIIGISPGAVSSPGIFKYFDESSDILSLAWERGLVMPHGGMSIALAEAELDNTSERYTPIYSGGQSELFTAILPRRPFIISAGFDVNGVEQTIPQFSGVVVRQPKVDTRNQVVSIEGADYNDFLRNRYLDQEVMFTSLRTDEVYENMLLTMGLSTAQYELDLGINRIKFGLFEKGTKYSDIFNDLAQAENGHFYQDESGIYRFENRQHWDSSPHNTVQRIIYTSDVLQAEIPNEDHIINVVEISTEIREKQPEQIIFNQQAQSNLIVNAGETIEEFFEFEDPVLALTDPTYGGTTSYFEANSAEDGTGTDLGGDISFDNVGTFARAVKFRISNIGSQTAYITSIVMSGRVAKQTSDLYYRARDDSSVTAYEERPYIINNPYIQDETWANSLATMILADFSEPENLQQLTIRAMPELQLGDLISWRGRYFRIFDIKTKLDPEIGFVQDITLLQRTIRTYFRIGISTIGGKDMIAP